MPKLPFRRRPYPVVNWCALRIGVACFYSQEKEKPKAAGTILWSPISFSGHWLHQRRRRKSLVLANSLIDYKARRSADNDAVYVDFREYLIRAWPILLSERVFESGHAIAVRYSASRHG
jgi:hypothetical protein